jgi:hypothetical protein
MPAAEPRSLQPGSEIEDLTVQACRAAEEGDWDRVEQCVIRRGELLERAGIPGAPTDHLVELDLRIQAAAMTAKAAVGAMLMELGQVRRNLRRLQQTELRPQADQSGLMNVTA